MNEKYEYELNYAAGMRKLFERSYKFTNQG